MNWPPGGDPVTFDRINQRDRFFSDASLTDFPFRHSATGVGAISRRSGPVRRGPTTQPYCSQSATLRRRIPAMGAENRNARDEPLTCAVRKTAEMSARGSRRGTERSDVPSYRVNRSSPLVHLPGCRLGLGEPLEACWTAQRGQTGVSFAFFLAKVGLF